MVVLKNNNVSFLFISATIESRCAVIMLQAYKDFNMLLIIFLFYGKKNGGGIKPPPSNKKNK